MIRKYQIKKTVSRWSISGRVNNEGTIQQGCMRILFDYNSVYVMRRALANELEHSNKESGKQRAFSSYVLSRDRPSDGFKAQSFARTSTVTWPATKSAMSHKTRRENRVQQSS